MSTDPYSTSKKTVDFNPDFYSIQVSFTQTPKPKKQIQVIQLLHTPFFSSIKRDLFSELLGTERKDEKDLMMVVGRSSQKMMTEIEWEQEDEEMQMQMQIEEESQNSNEMEEEQEMSTKRVTAFQDDNRDCGKRRRRKNNIQLKILQHEFQKRQGEWNKNEILQMAELTGLSEGQVYKWCWDQRKKTTGCSGVMAKGKENEKWSGNQDKGLERTKMIAKKGMVRVLRKEVDEGRVGSLRRKV